MNDQLEQAKTYVRQQLSSGFTPDQVATQLRGAQWTDEHIQQVFSAVQADIMPSGFTAAPVVTTAAAPSGVPPQAAPSNPGVIRTGWRLFKQSLALMRGNRYLFRYTVMSAVWALVVSLGFFGVMIGVILLTHNNANLTNGLADALVVLVYILLFFVANLYAAGLSANVLDLFHGQRQPYRTYMHTAWQKAPTLLAYSAIEATIGLLLRVIAERVRFVGWIIARLLGAIWSLSTLFTIPIIMTTDKPRAFRSIKQSMSLFKATWGEGITSKVSIHAVVFLLTLASLIPFSLLLLLVGAGAHLLGGLATAILIFVIVAAWLLFLVLLSLFATLATSIINVALFYYATTKQVPPAFDADLLNSVYFKRQRLFGRS